MPLVIVRCDGNQAIGMGHVSRGLALGEALRDRRGWSVAFAMRGADSAGVAAVRAARFDIDLLASSGAVDYGPELFDLAKARGAAALVVDVRDALSRESLADLRRGGVRIVTIDDGTERRLASDLAFYPPLASVAAMNWSGFTGRRYVGWEWVLLRREFASDSFVSPELSASSPSIDLLVTMGGSDPAGMTEFVLDSLELLPMPLAVRAVLGPAFARADAVAAMVARSKHSLQIERAPASLAPLMRASRMAVAAFGVSAYELAACGVPALHLSLTADHVESSRAFEREGAAVALGEFGGVTAEQVAEAVRRMMSTAGRRGQMAKRASQLVDGRGAERIAGLVVAGL